MLAQDGRDPRYVPANWRQMLDSDEWRLNEEGLPSRKAARVIALRKEPSPSVLLVIGHDFADTEHRWAFTPGGGILPGEDSQTAALRELTEETGIVLPDSTLVGPVVRRSSRFAFRLVTCRQDEEMFLARLDDAAVYSSQADDGQLDRSGWTDLERKVLDSLRWWDLDELDRAVSAGMTVYPRMLPTLVRELMEGWDGVVRTIIEDD